ISSSGAHGSTVCSTSTSSSSSHPQRQTAIDITAADLLGKLSIGNLVDLVLLSMLLLPEKMPASFLKQLIHQLQRLHVKPPIDDDIEEGKPI
ncbi:unnamed protein product, partial [Rotaria sp. Silwood2]